MMRRLTLIAMMMMVAGPALAADERRLNPAEVERILDTAAQKGAAPVTEALAPARPIEGEVGLSIGTGGYREVFGMAVVPVGADGVAVISIDTVESNCGRSRRRR